MVHPNHENVEPRYVGLLLRLWAHINSSRRKQLAVLLFLLIMASFAEIVSIGAILPFLGVLVSPEQVFSNAALQPLIRVLGVSDPEQLILPLTVLFAISALLAGLMRVLLLWERTRVNYRIGADLGHELYKSVLYQPYSVHMDRNSSDAVALILEKTRLVIYQTVNPILLILSSSVLVICIVSVLIMIDPQIAISALLGCGCLYGIIIQLSRNRLSRNGEILARLSPQVVKSVQEGLGGIRDVIIGNVQQLFIQMFYDADYTRRRVEGSSEFIGQLPKFLIEALGMVLIAVVAFSMVKQTGGLERIIPVLGALALGAQRLLPVLQHIFYGWSTMQNSRAVLVDVLDILDEPLPEYDLLSNVNPISFVKDIVVKDVSFQYSDEGPWILKNVNLNIDRGSRVGFYGSTGSGKSTLLDIVMGLIQPSSGSLEIDGTRVDGTNFRNWQAHISTVPQDIFISDSSIAENIAYGVPVADINLKKVRDAANQAQVSDVIETWDDQYATILGERGVRLSGGQRQRIGIARALYKNTDVVVFDEATSALDDETERQVMDAIDSLGSDLTILIIAHRITTLRNCSTIVEIEHGKIVRHGAYETMFADSGLEN